MDFIMRINWTEMDLCGMKSKGNSGLRELVGILLLVFLIFVKPSFSDAQGLNIDEEVFDIIFYQGFNNTSLGLLNIDEWKKDWNYPQYTNGVDKTEIIDMDGNHVMKFNYPFNSRGPSGGGGQWLSDFGNGHEEVYFSWNMMFKPGFEWVLGGKLPGLGGGNNPGGGKVVNWDDGFSCRVMWAKDTGPEGKMFFYVYNVDKTHTYGDKYAFGDAAKFDVSDFIWYNMTIRLTLNSINPDLEKTDPENAGYRNGLMEFFMNGKLIYSKTGFRWRHLRTIWLDTMHITSFFGGSGDEWRNQRVEWLLLDDFCVFTYKDGVGAPSKRVPSKAGRIIPLPNLIIEKPDLSDDEAPTIPSRLRITGVSDKSIGLEWDPSSDNVSVKGYRIFVNNKEVGTSILKNYTATGLDPNTTYIFEVSAFDANHNESAQSLAITGITIDPDTENPTIPRNLRSIGSNENSITFEWDPSTDNNIVLGYQVFLNDEALATTKSTQFSALGLDASSVYRIQVSAYDASSNESSKSEEVVISTTAPDLESPTTPKNGRVILTTNNSISIEWEPSSDNLAVVGYHVYLNDKIIAISNESSYTILGLTPGIKYDIEISAFDALGNVSSRSMIIEASTKNPDGTSKPTMPDISIVDITKSISTAVATSKINSIGHAELEDFGILLEPSSKGSYSDQQDTILYAPRGSATISVSGWINEDLQLLYDFADTDLDKIQDVKPGSDPINLELDSPLSFYQISGRGVKAVGGGIAASDNVSVDFFNSFKATNEITLEAWIKSDQIDQSGSATIFSISKGIEQRALTLSQTSNHAAFRYDVQLNTSSSNKNELPIVSSSEFISLNLQHVVFVRNKNGVEKLYVNGVEMYSRDREGDFSTWDDNYKVVLANEINEDLSWKGSYYLVALYNRALEDEEIVQNYNAGLGEIQFETKLGLIPNVPYTVTPFASTNLGIVFGDPQDLVIENITIGSQVDLENRDTLLIAVYPNPSPGDFNVEFIDTGKKSTSAIIRVIDQTGRIFFNHQINLPEGTYEGKEYFDLSTILSRKGFYSVGVIMGSKYVSHKLIIL
jgi:chitodextrinase